MKRKYLIITGESNNVEKENIVLMSFDNLDNAKRKFDSFKNGAYKRTELQLISYQMILNK